MYNWMWNCLSEPYSSEYVSKCIILFVIVYLGKIGHECVTA